MNLARVSTQDSPRGEARTAEPERRLMAAVLHMTLEDCQGSGHPRVSGRLTVAGKRRARKALVYAASSDRTWPYSFVNLCDALGVNAGLLRRELRRAPVPTRFVSRLGN